MKTLFRWLLGLVLIFFAVIAGAYFGLKRADIPYAVLDQRYSSPASKFIELPSGVRAHYRIEGKLDGPTLLLVHGFGMNLETWAAWVPELRNEFCLVSVDYPGHGLTQAPADYTASSEGLVDFVDEFTRALNLKKLVVVGNSRGGAIAWQFTVKHPERVNTLVLISAIGWRTDDGDDTLAVQLFSSPKLQPWLVDLDFGGFMQSGLNAAYENKAIVTDAMITRYSEMTRAPGHRRILAKMLMDRDTKSLATAELMAKIRVPTLILWGNSDALIPATDATKFGNAIADSKVILYDGVGHLVHEEIPVKSAADLKAFLAALNNDTRAIFSMSR